MDKRNTIIATIEREKKFHETLLGYTSFTIAFDVLKLHGNCVKKERFNALQNAICDQLRDGSIIKEQAAKNLGLDLRNCIYAELFENAIKDMQDRYHALQEQDGRLLLSSGQSVIESRYAKDFVLYVDSFQSVKLKSAFEGKDIKITKEKVNDSISLNDIKKLASEQAPEVQDYDSNYFLESAGIDSESSYHAEQQVYLCFVQNMTTKDYRVVVINKDGSDVITPLNSYFDNLPELKAKLLSSAIEQNDCIEYVEEDFCADNESNDIPDNVGSIMSAMEFRKKLDDIFAGNYDEIWLVSPWVRDGVFIKNLLPKIKSNLNYGCLVFVIFSEDEMIDGKANITNASLKEIESLDKKYENFYWEILPAFHQKNVITRKEENINLFGGSYNVLSFTASNGKTRKCREEQMYVASKEYSKKIRKDYLTKIIDKYKNTEYRILGISASLQVAKLNNLKSGNELSEYPKGVLIQDEVLTCDTKLKGRLFNMYYKAKKENNVYFMLSCLLYLYMYTDSNKRELIKLLYDLLHKNQLPWSILKGNTEDTRTYIILCDERFLFKFEDASQGLMIALLRHGTYIDFNKYTKVDKKMLESTIKRGFRRFGS